MNSIPKSNPATNSLGIRGRLYVGFGLILLTILTAMTIILIKVTSVEVILDKVNNYSLPAYDAYLNLNGRIYESQSSLHGYLITHDSTYQKEFSSAWKSIDNSQVKLDNLSMKWDQDALKKWNDTKSSLDKLKAIQNKILEQPTHATELLPASTAILNHITDTLDGELMSDGNRPGGLFDLKYMELKDGLQTILANMDTLRIIVYGLLFVGIIASLVIAYYTAHSILTYVNIFREHSNRVASGNLTERIAVRSNDEMGLLGHDLNTMTENLSLITRQITEACLSMVSSLEEVKHSLNAQSSGASEQASSVNEITASLDEIEKSSIQTNEKAKSLGEVAELTREKGQLGLDAVEKSIVGMKEVRDKVQIIAQTILDLSNQTQQVGEITAVVNKLAQQSKMLALNASIEAAKAGEAGKGFAVVAAEVKTLAEQSEQSTFQVQKILEDISRATEKAVMATEEGTKGVDEGTRLVEQTGEVVRSLSGIIHDASMASQQIQAAIHQEGIGIEQITSGMNEINQVTSSFVASVNQTTEAIEKLSTISKNLKEYVDVYKI